MSRDERKQLDPQWLAHRFDEATNEIRFVEHDRATRALVPFLTDSYLPEKAFLAQSRDQARQVAPARAPIHFVFHSGFCCSTLFAACFDQPGLATAFSEPMILNDLTGWRQRGASPSDVGRLLDDALTFLSRPFDGDQASILKPSTVVNGLAKAMMHVRPHARAVVMYAPIGDFLISIAKKGLDGRRWARELFVAMRKEGLTDNLGFSDEDYFGQTDLQIAAVAWLCQQQLFANLLHVYPDRVRSLSSERFLERPEAAINAAASLFDVQMSKDNIAAAKSGALARNSKDGKPFGHDAREAEYRAARAAYGDEVEKVRIWADAVAASAGLVTALPNSLF